MPVVPLTRSLIFVTEARDLLEKPGVVVEAVSEVVLLFVWGVSGTVGL